jgi:hypothetical protein
VGFARPGINTAHMLVASVFQNFFFATGRNGNPLRFCVCLYSKTGFIPHQIPLALCRVFQNELYNGIPNVTVKGLLRKRLNFFFF